MKDFSVVLFDRFETLDAMGPVEAVGRLAEDFRIRFWSPEGGVVHSTQGVGVETLPWAGLPAGGALLIPGGQGTRTLVDDPEFTAELTRLVNTADQVLTVCSGSALLARTGALDGRRATGNKMAFGWNAAQGPRTHWQPRARWVQDGRFWTSSGVSAGMDMALAWVADRCGREAALRSATEMEYIWHENPEDDPFEAVL